MQNGHSNIQQYPRALGQNFSEYLAQVLLKIEFKEMNKTSIPGDTQLRGHQKRSPGFLRLDYSIDDPRFVPEKSKAH